MPANSANIAGNAVLASNAGSAGLASSSVQLTDLFSVSVSSP